MDQLDFCALYAPTARKFAVVLGANEIASAIAARLARARYAVAMSHDPFPPTIRRGMAFHDALYGDRARVDGVDGVRVDTAVELASASMRDKCVAVTTMHLSDLLALRPIDVLVDARLQKNRVTPDYRHYVRLAIGLGPNFIVGENCDIAVETRPDQTGGLVESGETCTADGKPRLLGGVGGERFVYTDRVGIWRTPLDIGMRAFRGYVVGHIDSTPVRAPMDGILRGLARDETMMPAGVKLLEVDGRGRRARWTGVDARGRTIAEAVRLAVKARAIERRAGARQTVEI
jgi:xanthine dehydrogenase accessory factor